MIPIIDFLNVNSSEGKLLISNEINKVCRECGFFYIINHNIDHEYINKLESICNKFFSLPNEIKEKWCIGILRGYHYGYFKNELINNNNDDEGKREYLKEGVYIGIEPLHGFNKDGISIYPTIEEEIKYDIVGFKDTIESYINQLIKLGDIVLELIAQSLNLPSSYFKDNYTINNPNSVLGLLKYPSLINSSSIVNQNNKLGMEDHTDLPFITLLYQNHVGGLQVKVNDQYINAPPIKGSFICNIGDMLEIATQHYYISNYHRVLPNLNSQYDRYSFPLFIGPEKDKTIKVINGFTNITTNKNKDIDNDIYNFRGTYREYLNMKMNKRGYL